jgi:hypothetical protein
LALIRPPTWTFLFPPTFRNIVASAGPLGAVASAGWAASEAVEPVVVAGAPA